MATSLGQLLDALGDHARAFDDSPAVRSDAATALGHVGRALAQLRRDGVSPIAGEVREQRVAALATACIELAALHLGPRAVVLAQPRAPDHYL